jgi:hypothetical protein
MWVSLRARLVSEILAPQKVGLNAQLLIGLSWRLL